jgi:hypothetical protein
MYQATSRKFSTFPKMFGDAWTERIVWNEKRAFLMLKPASKRVLRLFHLTEWQLFEQKIPTHESFLVDHSVFLHGESIA